MTPQAFLVLIRDYDRKTNDNLDKIRVVLKAKPFLVANQEVLSEYSQIASKYKSKYNDLRDLNAWPIEYRSIDLKHFFIKMVFTDAAKTYFYTLISEKRDFASAQKLLGHYPDLSNTIVGESQTADGLLNKHNHLQLAGTKHDVEDDDVKHACETDSDLDAE